MKVVEETQVRRAAQLLRLTMSPLVGLRGTFTFRARCRRGSSVEYGKGVNERALRPFEWGTSGRR